MAWDSRQGSMVRAFSSAAMSGVARHPAFLSSIADLGRWEQVSTLRMGVFSPGSWSMASASSPDTNMESRCSTVLADVGFS